jgi:beta-lactamase regulating signal transducer with metallopeptidase domain
MNYHRLNAAAQITAERMIDSLLIGLALAVFAWMLLRVIPRPNSATRFAVWLTTLIATAFLPLFDIGSLAPATRPLISFPATWALYLALAWSVIAALALLRVGAGLLELRRLRRTCRPIHHGDPAWQDTIARLCPGRRVEILTSDRIHVPTALGFIRPAVIIPTGLREQLSSEELKHVLLHELAHLRRWDDWTNLVQKIVKALLFFHPAVWWVEGRISLEREMACDDAVLAETSSPRAYAECLATLAEKSFLRRSAALAQAAVNRIRQTTLRVAQILDVNRPKAAPARKSAVALVGVFACACLGVATQVPRLISFQDAAPTLAAMPPAPVPQLPLALDRAPVAPRSPSRLAKRNSSPAGVIQAKTGVRRPSPSLARAEDLEVAAAQRTHAPRVIPARAAVTQQPAFTTGVLVIIVDDPVFGPTPIVYHFAVWQIAPSQTAEHGTPQKKT